MRKTSFLIAMFSMCACVTAASAADRMKPGLWSMTIKSDAMKNMPKMSPDQMEAMRKMGVNIPQMQDGGMVVKVCMTKEMVERDQPPATSQNESGCQMKNFNRSGDGYSMDMLCDSPNFKGTGTVKGSNPSKESFTSISDFKGTAHGQPANHHQETSGKWLAADCGDVKPMSDMMPKK
jgi:hypothetical protein